MRKQMMIIFLIIFLFIPSNLMTVLSKDIIDSKTIESKKNAYGSRELKKRCLDCGGMSSSGNIFSIFQNSYDVPVRQRNISDLLFHYYSSFDESWMSYRPNLDIREAYLIANALYNTFQELKTEKYGDSLHTITYLAYTFRNETYISEAESYWDWLWSNRIVNHTTYFMLLKSDSRKAGVAFQMWSLYWLWKLTGKQKFYGNLTNLVSNYQRLVLRNIGYPLGTTLKTTLLLNSSGEYIIDVINGSYEISTWAGSMRAILIFLSEEGFLNKTLLAKSLHRLLQLIYNSNLDLLAEGVRVYIYERNGSFVYQVKPYYFFNPPRQHTQRVAAYIWANNVSYDSTTEILLEKLALNKYYRVAEKIYSYGINNEILEQYGVAVAFAHWLLRPEVVSQALNSCIIHGLVGPNFPAGWKIEWDLTIQHARLIYFDAKLGKFSSDSSTPGWKLYVNVYLYFLIDLLAWLSDNFWVTHNPHYYYAVEAFYSKTVRGSPPEMYGVTDGNVWAKDLSFASRHGFNLFILFHGAHPNLAFKDLILAESNSVANPYIVLFSPWNEPKLNHGNFSVIIRNVRVPLDETSYIFIPSKKYHIKAIRISEGSQKNNFVIGIDNFTLVNDTHGNIILVSALPDNVIVFNPIYIKDKNSTVVFNITVDMIEHNADNYWEEYKSWYSVSEESPISYAYWLCYTNNISNNALDPDIDYDNDGVPTRYEVLFMSDPYKNDTDEDGIDDGDEIFFLINPLSEDTDCDGLTDSFELLGAKKWSKYLHHELNPRNPKSYNSTYYDIFYGFILENQTENLEKWDEFRFNETKYRLDLDTDGDNVNNYDEIYTYKTDPFRVEIPSLIVYSPENNSIEKSKVNIIFSTNSIRDYHIMVYINGSEIYSEYYYSGQKNITIQYDTSNITKGRLNITIAVYDLGWVGVNRSVIFVNVSNIPDIIILTPSNHSFKSKTFNLSFWANESASKVVVLINSTEIASFSHGGNITIGIDTSAYEDGWKNITVVAILPDNRHSKTTLWVYFDNTKPIISFGEDNTTNQTLYLSYEAIYLNICILGETKTTFSNITILINGSIYYINTTYSTTYIVFVNIATLDGGAYNISILTFDKAGNRDSSYLIIGIAHYLSVNIINPKDGDIIYGNITVNVTVNTDYPWTQVTVLLGDQTLLDIMTKINVSYGIYVDTTEFLNGQYQINASAKLILMAVERIVEIHIINIEIQNIPNFFVEGLVNNTLYRRNPISIKVTLINTSDMTFNNLTIYVNNTQIYINTTYSKSYLIILNLSNDDIFPGGVLTIVFLMRTDNGKAKKRYVIGVYRDPTATLIKPHNNSWIGGEYIFEVMVDTDYSQVCTVLLINDTQITSIHGIGNFSIRINTSAYDDGWWNITIVVMLKFLGKNHILKFVYYRIGFDNTPPVAKVLFYPNDTYFPVGAHVNVTIVVYLKLEPNYGGWKLFTPVGVSRGIDNTTITVELMWEGLWNLTVEVYDTMGNAAKFLALLRVYGGIDMLSVVPNGTVYLNSSTVTFNVSAWDRSGVNISIYVDDTLFLSTSKNLTVSIELSEGKHDIKIVARDPYGSEEEIDILVIVDLTAPEISINGTIGFGVFVILFEDANLKSAVVVVDNKTYYNGANETVKIGPLDEGYHLISAVAFDLAGNKVVGLWLVVVDALQPEIIIRQNKSIIRIEVIEHTVKEIKIYLNSSLLQRTYGNTTIFLPWEGLWNITVVVESPLHRITRSRVLLWDVTPPSIDVNISLKKGRIIIVARAEDNVGISILTLIVNNTKINTTKKIACMELPADIPAKSLNITAEAIDCSGNRQKTNIVWIVDPDNDRLNNKQEEELGTDPLNPDTDHDGIWDSEDPLPTINNFIIVGILLVLSLGGISYKKLKSFIRKLKQQMIQIKRNEAPITEI